MCWARTCGLIYLPCLFCWGFAVPAVAQRPQQAQGAGVQIRPPFPGLLSAEALELDLRADQLHRLLTSRYNAAVAELRVHRSRHDAGMSSIEPMFDVASRLIESGLELSSDRNEQLDLLSEYIEVLGSAEKHAQLRRNARMGTAADLHKARHDLLDAEVRLFRAAAGAGAGKLNAADDKSTSPGEDDAE